MSGLLMSHTIFLATTPAARIDARGPMWRQSDVTDFLVAEISINRHFQRRAKLMSNQIAEATEIVQSATNLFEKSFERFLDSEKRVSDATKATGGKVRKAANELHEGIQRIEKMANFDKLERQVAILERAAEAMKVLAELEKSGSLKRITDSLRP